tara:strand:+ start:90 stop:368 length:279 start_codon:yes stop_codon:yes gene_type:complete
MNTKANTADNAETMTAWDMASSCLVGLSKSVSKARTEYNEVVTAAAGNSMGKGVMQAAHTINVIAAATRVLEQDMRQHARSNGLTMPNLEEV